MKGTVIPFKVRSKTFVFIMDWLLGINILNWIIIILSFILMISFIWKGIIGLIIVIAILRSGKNEVSD